MCNTDPLICAFFLQISQSSNIFNQIWGHNFLRKRSVKVDRQTCIVNCKFHLNSKESNAQCSMLNNTERTCTRANCLISNTNLCLLCNVVYQITCNNCNQHYIGSTTCFVHDRVREHLNNDSSSVKKHISKCQNKVHKGIEIKTIALEKDPANLRLFEAFYIRKYKPTLNSREECSKFADLLF